AGHFDGDGDVFVGAGLAAIWSPGGGPWYVEGSLMPGYYDKGSNGFDLGGDVSSDHSLVSAIN
ncbi:MAG: hypothetical protein WBV78_09405, partial [Roseobacter sp.]